MADLQAVDALPKDIIGESDKDLFKFLVDNSFKAGKSHKKKARIFKKFEIVWIIQVVNRKNNRKFGRVGPGVLLRFKFYPLFINCEKHNNYVKHKRL